MAPATPWDEQPLIPGDRLTRILDPTGWFVTPVMVWHDDQATAAWESIGVAVAADHVGGVYYLCHAPFRESTGYYSDIPVGHYERGAVRDRTGRHVRPYWPST